MFEKIIRFAIEQRWFVLLAHFLMKSAQARDNVPIIPVYRFQIEALARRYVSIAHCPIDYAQSIRL